MELVCANLSYQVAVGPRSCSVLNCDAGCSGSWPPFFLLSASPPPLTAHVSDRNEIPPGPAGDSGVVEKSSSRSSGIKGRAFGVGGPLRWKDRWAAASSGVGGTSLPGETVSREEVKDAGLGLGEYW